MKKHLSPMSLSMGVENTFANLSMGVEEAPPNQGA